MPERCPTCGSSVQVHTGREGTSRYEPAGDERTRTHIRELTLREQGYAAEAEARAAWDSGRAYRRAAQVLGELEGLL